jgi:anti-sigma regulatory factor (Ser/Thr protein kinase)
MASSPRPIYYGEVTITHTRRFPARVDELPNVAGFVEASVAGMPPRVITRAQLVAEELFVNTVTHGHGGDSDATVDVTVRADADRITVVYEDSAPPYDPFASVASPDPAATLEDRSVGRLGVFLITRLAARCDYARAGGRNRVTVELPVG